MGYNFFRPSEMSFRVGWTDWWENGEILSYKDFDGESICIKFEQWTKRSLLEGKSN